MEISDKLIEKIKLKKDEVLSDHSLLPHRRPFKEIKEVFFNSNNIICYIEVECAEAPVWIFHYDYPQNFFESSELKDMDSIEELIFENEDLVLGHVSEDAFDLHDIRFSDTAIEIVYFDSDYATIRKSMSFQKLKEIKDILLKS